jgi:hypothetical protein
LRPYPEVRHGPPVEEWGQPPTSKILTQNCSCHIIIKTPNTLNKERIRGKGQVTFEGRPIRITPDFLPETMKARRSWVDVIQTLREHKCQPRLLYPTKLSITIDGENKMFHDKTKFTQNLSTNPARQRIINAKHRHKERNYTLEKRRK